MFQSLKQGFLALLFGTSALVTPTSVTLGPGEMVIRALKPIKPVYDSMQVFIDLGKINDERKKAIVSGNFGMKDIGQVDVQICKTESECLPMTYSGSFFSSDAYGIEFALTDDRAKKATFTLVKIHTARSLPNAIVRWQNYSK
jgi:hypothetical protein